MLRPKLSSLEKVTCGVYHRPKISADEGKRTEEGSATELSSDAQCAPSAEGINRQKKKPTRRVALSPRSTLAESGPQTAPVK